MNVEPLTLKKLRELLDASADWGQRIEQYAADYGQLNSSQATSLQEDKLRGLWSAQGFALVKYELPKATADQLKRLRSLTALLADRRKSLGERFCEAREECDKFFKTQLPVILRALLILEGGSYGTVGTKSYSNLLLKWAGKPELDYREAVSITLALKNVRTLIEEWAPKVDATKLGERARIPWHLCEIIAAEGSEGEKHSKSDSEHTGWKFTKWMGPLLDALRALGGSGTPKAVHQKIQGMLRVPDSVLAEKMGGSDQSRFYNEVAWARQYLVWEGLVESPTRGTWELTAEGQKTVLNEQQAQEIAIKWSERHKQTGEPRPGSGVSNSTKEPDLIVIDGENIQPKTEIEPYDKVKAMKSLFLAEIQFDEMLAALAEKKNVVLQGAPGVGKTYIAKRLAYALIGSNDPQRIEMIQFHQSYSYEDFIQGFRPTPKGHFDLKYGIFHHFCQRAQHEEAQGKPYVFIIDEINRGNLSKIFGELMMLIEPDKRGKEHAIRLAYSQDADERFYIPENLHLIGMMNTADRSLAMVDYALRRRFRFITLRPELSSEGFRSFLADAGAKPELVQKIVGRMAALNEVIAADTKNLGLAYQIGHSYFCLRNGIKLDDGWYRRVIESEIMPLIQEYWFDNEQKVKEQRMALLA